MFYSFNSSIHHQTPGIHSYSQIMIGMFKHVQTPPKRIVFGLHDTILRRPGPLELHRLRQTWVPQSMPQFSTTFGISLTNLTTCFILWINSIHFTLPRLPTCFFSHLLKFVWSFESIFGFFHTSVFWPGKMVCHGIPFSHPFFFTVKHEVDTLAHYLG